MSMQQQLVDARRAELEADGQQWLEEKVDEELKTWDEENPRPDEDEDGAHAVQVWEDDRESMAEEIREYWAVELYENRIPEQMERFEEELMEMQQ